MKKIIITAIIALFTLNSYSQGIEFFNGTFDEALTKAKSENKLLFVDFYTEWCGPCKKMSAEIFPKPKIGEFFNKHFVSLKLDAEKGEGIEISKKWEVKGFPTLIFFNNDGTENKRLVGATPDAEFFLSFAKQVTGEGTPFLEKYETYKKGYRNHDFVRDLILTGGVYASTLPREEQIPWYEKFAEMAHWYFIVKQPHEMMNGEDFRLISMYLDGPNNGNPFVEHIYNNYEEWAKIIPNEDLSMFIFRTNNQSMHQSYQDGNLKWKEYLEAIYGRLDKVYKETPDAEQDDSYQVMKFVCEAGYCLHGTKDLDSYMDWQDKYLAYEKEKGHLNAFSYSVGPSNMYHEAKDIITPAQAKRALKKINTGIKQYPDNTSLWLAKGDYLALLGDKKAATECFNKIIELSKGQRGEDYFKEEMAKKIEALKVTTN